MWEVSVRGGGGSEGCPSWHAWRAAASNGEGAAERNRGLLQPRSGGRALTDDWQAHLQPDLLQQAEAVHVRHVDVRQHQLELAPPAAAAATTAAAALLALLVVVVEILVIVTVLLLALAQQLQGVAPVGARLDCRGETRRDVTGQSGQGRKNSGDPVGAGADVGHAAARARTLVPAALQHRGDDLEAHGVVIHHQDLQQGAAGRRECMCGRVSGRHGRCKAPRAPHSTLVPRHSPIQAPLPPRDF